MRQAAIPPFPGMVLVSPVQWGVMEAFAPPKGEKPVVLVSRSRRLSPPPMPAPFRRLVLLRQ